VSEPKLPETLEGAVWLSRNRIRPNPEQPREYFEPAALAELSASIREHGILQPLLVRYEPSRYDGTPYLIIAGERRYRASEGIREKLPCMIVDVTPETARVLALTENIQRKDLTAMEEALALAELMTERRLSSREVARLLNMTHGWVNNRLMLLKTGDDVQAVAARVPFAMSSLLLIDTIKDDAEERRSLLEAVQDGTPHAAIKARIEARALQQKLERQTHQAPDAQTAVRTRLHARTGGGNVSRGELVTGNSAAEARAEVGGALSEIERQLRTLEAWKAQLSPAQWKREVGRVRSLREGLERLEEN